MLFNSLEYFLFLPIVFTIYWLLYRQYKLQNILLLVASYFFYACWDYRFLSLIIISSVTDYILGLKIYNSEDAQKRKMYLWISLIVNLGFLFVFKYFNFFFDSFKALSEQVGLQVNASSLEIILPVGISFYTFQTLSYTIDIYRSKLKPADSIISFFTYVAFFPQLVAGPIERASNLLPQFYRSRSFSFDKGRDACRQILWGLFKKVVIADNCAVIVDSIMNLSIDSAYLGSYVWLGAILFSIQIYCDFSGYSDIAIGTARLLGFDLKQNFASPYFSRNLPEFWRRWHISLSTWFRDYLYIPLGGSRGSKANQVRNVFAIFLVSGLWHGASWNFVFWGLVHSLIFLIYVFSNNTKTPTETVAQNSFFPSIKELLSMIFTFFIVTIAWVFFRIEDILLGFSYLKNMFLFPFIDKYRPGMVLKRMELDNLNAVVFFIILMFIIEWVNRKHKHGLYVLFQNVILRYLLYFILIFSTLQYFYGEHTFIYFQF